MSAYTLAEVVAGRRTMICARDTDSVGDAIQLMLTHRVAQLPVVAENGTLRGVISQQSILSLYFYANGQVDLLRMPLAHCQDSATTLSMHADLLAAIDQLRTPGIYAVVVTDEERPVGILTGRDMTHLFRTLFEGMLMVEQIEVTLRACIALAFPDPESQAQALLALSGPSRQHKKLPAQNLDSLSFTTMLNLITAPANWPLLDPLLGPKTIFDPLMERVRLVRNEIAHFQGRPDALELDTLRQAALWLANRRAVPLPARKKSASLLMPNVTLHPLTDILAQRKPPMCVEEGTTISAVLRLMVEHRYAQVPVIDPMGNLIGMINQPTILSLYYFTKGDAPLLDLPIHHVMDSAAELSEADNLFRAVDLLTSPGIAAAVVTREHRPLGILTGKDVTHFFRTLFEGIILVERIELALREHVSHAYPNEDLLNVAAIATFGPDPENPSYAMRNPHKLSFGDRLLLIADNDNWPCFDAVLGPRVIFLHLMQRVREVRNELMHFKGQLDSLERSALVQADNWLQQRPPWPDVSPPQSAPHPHDT